MKAHSIAALCRRARMSRQNYYAQRRTRQRRAVDGDLVVRLVRQERQVQPRLGGRKLLHLVGKELRENKVEIGRDRFFGMLREHGLLLEPKPARPKTTNSRHSRGRSSAATLATAWKRKAACVPWMLPFSRCRSAPVRLTTRTVAVSIAAICT
jgi:hypothetical protein